MGFVLELPGFLSRCLDRQLPNLSVCTIRQCFSNFKAFRSLIKTQTAGVLFHGLWFSFDGGPRICIFNKFLGGADAACLGITLLESVLISSYHHSSVWVFLAEQLSGNALLQLVSQGLSLLS